MLSYASKRVFAVCYDRYDEGALDLENSRVLSHWQCFVYLYMFIEYIIYLSTCTKPTIRLRVARLKELIFLKEFLNSLSMTKTFQSVASIYAFLFSSYFFHDPIIATFWWRWLFLHSKIVFSIKKDRVIGIGKADWLDLLICQSSFFSAKNHKRSRTYLIRT